MAGRKITLALGLVSVDCMSNSAVEKPEEPKNLCVGQPGKEAHEPSPSTAPATCTVCGPITDRSVLVKGFKQGDAYAIVSQEDVAEAKESYAKEFKGTMTLVPHPAQDFLGETMPGDTLNYLTPRDANHADRYQLLVKLVESHPEYAFAGLYTPTSVTALFMLRVKDGVLVMEKRTRTQNVKPAPSVGGTANDMLFAQLDGMLGMFVTDYDPVAYEDRYAAAVADLVAQAEQVVANAAPEGRVAAPVARVSDEDLMAKLQALQGAKSAKPAKKKAKKSSAKSASKVETAA